VRLGDYLVMLFLSNSISESTSDQVETLHVGTVRGRHKDPVTKEPLLKCGHKMYRKINMNPVMSSLCCLPDDCVSDYENLFYSQ